MNPLAGNPLETRDDFARAMMDLWRPLRPYYSKAGARVSLSDFGAHFAVAAAELEGFARPLWGIAPYLAGGGAFPDLDLLLSGLFAGSDPGHPEYWGPIGDSDQRCVEAAAIAFALMMAPQHLWEPLPAVGKDNLAAWLGGALRVQVPDNNWNFFVVLAGTALKRLGRDTDGTAVDAAFARLESYWIGNGWYRDGPHRRVDHYIGFAMHFYGLLYARLNGDADPARAATFRQRAADFAPHFARWFDGDGGVIPFGRSMTYRFATGSFWGALGYAASHPTARGMLLRHLRWWRDNGAFDRDGVLPVGYGYPNPQMAESYNSAQSPYWAFKAFLPLALGADDAFWSAPEEPPAPLPTAPVAQPEAGMVITTEPQQVVALAGGQQAVAWFRHSPEKYGKFAYSSRYGFSVESDLRDFEGGAFDSMLAVSIDGRSYSVRDGVTAARMTDELLYSAWSPIPGVDIETWLRPAGIGHLRVHRLRTSTRCRVGEGGFAVPRLPIETQRAGPGVAVLETARDFAAIRAIEGAGRIGVVLAARPNTNLMTPRTWVAQLRGSLEPGEHVLACHVVASPDRQAARAAFEAPSPRWSLGELIAQSSAAPPTIAWALD